MKYIIKSSSPSEFEAWKNEYQLTETELSQNYSLEGEKDNIWGKFSGEIKTKVKESLLSEQGFICCYCQQRVELSKQTIIEHFIARDIEPTMMFNYDNILVCCDGGDERRTEEKKEKRPKSKRTPLYCDRKKANKKLLVNPLDELCESHFSYSFNFDPKKPKVEITHLSPEGEESIQQLNLNIPHLDILRGAEIAGFIFDEHGDVLPDEDIQELFSVIKQKQNNKFQPFCIVLESVLKKL
ncbi:MAG: TIGR02646 family protein [Methylococcaceae bacterium]|nr:TIGR02646 family protein [Methylococcaceae bacterium]